MKAKEKFLSSLKARLDENIDIDEAIAEYFEILNGETLDSDRDNLSKCVTMAIVAYKSYRNLYLRDNKNDY